MSLSDNLEELVYSDCRIVCPNTEPLVSHALFHSVMFHITLKKKDNPSQMTNSITKEHNISQSILKITKLGDLPNSVQKLYCYCNNITKLENLPPNLIEVYCYGNKINKIENLPNSLKIFYYYRDNPMITNNIKKYKRFTLKSITSNSILSNTFFGK
jgi:hypothetical protein